MPTGVYKHHANQGFQKGNRLGVGERNVNWKGEGASYVAKHIWASNNFGRPKKCEECGRERKMMHWANISGKYKRDRSDWRRLCVPCHSRFDRSRRTK